MYIRSDEKMTRQLEASGIRGNEDMMVELSFMEGDAKQDALYVSVPEAWWLYTAGQPVK